MTPVLWKPGRLTVRVNPEWRLRIDGSDVIVKLYLKRDRPLTQRLANPLIALLDLHIVPSIEGAEVVLLDVHRGKPFRRTRASAGMRTVLGMQAAAFIAGWDAIAGEQAA